MTASVLHTDRCTLVPWTPTDRDELEHLLRLPTVRRHLLDDQLVERHWVQARIQDSIDRFERGSFGLWTIRVDDSLAGFAGFLPVFDPPVLELIYGLHPEHTGRGVATEAARAVIEVYRAAGNRVVRASIDEPNHASHRVLVRLGFHETRRDPPTETLPTQVHFELVR